MWSVAAVSRQSANGNAGQDSASGETSLILISVSFYLAQYCNGSIAELLQEVYSPTRAALTARRIMLVALPAIHTPLIASLNTG
jgi:hypothetical protein